MPPESAIGAPRSRYSQIADVIRARIDNGRYPPGSQLPSEQDLAAEFDVSRVTVNRAISSLRAAGFVRVRRGAGTVVRATPRIVRDAHRRYAQRYAGAGAADVEARQLRLAPHTQYVAIGRVSVPPDVAPLLHLKLGAPVLERRRRLFANDEPTQIADSYIPWEIAKDCPPLFERDAGPGGSYARLADIGHGPVRFSEDVTVRTATDIEAQVLDLDGPQPVIEIMHVAFSGDHTPVEVAVHVLPGSMWTLHYEWDESLPGQESSR